MRGLVGVIACETFFACSAFGAFCSGDNRTLFFSGMLALVARAARLILKEWRR